MIKIACLYAYPSELWSLFRIGLDYITGERKINLPCNIMGYKFTKRIGLLSTLPLKCIRYEDTVQSQPTFIGIYRRNINPGTVFNYLLA